MKRGMTLLEVVLAMAILWMVLVMTTAVLIRAMREIRRQEHTTRAAFLAQGKLESLMALPSQALQPQSGSFSPPFQAYRWTQEIQSLADDFLFLQVTVEGPSQARFSLFTRRRAEPRVLWFASNRDGHSQLYHVQDDGTQLERIVSSSNDSHPALSPDGSQVAFVSDRGGGRQIYVMPSDQKLSAQLLVPSSLPISEPCWSPDGKRLAYTGYENGYSQVFVFNLIEKKSLNLTQAARHEGHPFFFPDGQLGLVTGAEEASQIVTMSGSGRRTLTPSQGWNTAPSSSPDGQRIVFMSNRGQNPEIYSMSRWGADLRRLTQDPAYDTGPRYSPDGKKVVFWSDRAGGKQLFLMDTDGSNPRPLLPKTEQVPLDYFEKDPAWSP